MERCPQCGEELKGARATAGGRPAPSRTRADRHAALLTLALGLAALVMLAGARLAPPLLARHQGCQPEGWRAWHAAMERACLEPAYVCEHMTTPGLLRDPEVASAYGPEVEAPRAAGLRSLVGRMRAAYGCAPEADPAPGRPFLEPAPGSPAAPQPPVAL